MVGRTEELLAGTTLLNDLNETGLELLNGGDVVGENTHLSGFGGDVDLDTIWERIVSMGRSRVKDGRPMISTYSECEATYTPVDLKIDC